MPGDILVYCRTDGALFSAPFDRRKLELAGPPVSILDGVRTVSSVGDVVLGADGTMLYLEGSATLSSTRLELVAVSRGGAAAHRVDSTWSASIAGNGGLALSPDGSRLALSVTDSTGARSDITVLHLPDGPATRLTFQGSTNIRPSWSSDGKTILYASDAGGKMEIWAKHADGSGRPVRIVSDERPVWEGLWSSDGEWIVYRTDDVAAGNGDILAVRTSGDSTPVPLAATPAEETGPALSPDGRWLAYASNVTGRKEVYVRPFPDAQNGLWQVSTDGGAEPRWSHDGKELFYRNGGDQLVVVEVTAAPTFAAGPHHVLFSARAYASNDDNHYYDVTPDDGMFLMLRPENPDQSVGIPTSGLVLVRDWLPEIRAKLGR